MRSPRSFKIAKRRISFEVSFHVQTYIFIFSKRFFIKKLVNFQEINDDFLASAFFLKFSLQFNVEHT